MKFSGSSLFYYLATAGVVSGVTATSNIKDEVGAGGGNSMSFKLSYGNADSSMCTACDLCERSVLQDVFDTKNTSLCISCTDENGCDEAIITTSFKTAWRMTYVSLSSHVGDNAFDPESVIILGSDNYDEGSKMGSWSILATSSSDLLFKKRNESLDVAVDNDALLTHYRFVFTRKDNSSPMKIGHIGVIESYLKSYSAELFEKLTDSKVVGLPTNAPTNAPTSKPTVAPTSKPTAAPTNPVGPEFTNESLKVAVNEWTADKQAALKTYGEMKHWGTSKVTSMEKLWHNNNEFNEDLSDWDTESVTSMKQMFDQAHKFNSDISAWNVSKVIDMVGMFAYAKTFNFNLSDWNVSNVTNFNYVFFRASSFAQVLCWDTSDLSTWKMFDDSKGGRADPNC